MTEQLTEHVDILIIGAGPVGMTLSLALAAGGQRSLLLDSRPRAAQQDDPRALALAHGARQLLEQIRAWPTRAATLIETIHVSQKEGFGRTVIDRADYDLPALGYVVRYRDLAAELAAQLPGDALLDAVDIVDVSCGDDHVSVSVRQDGAEITPQPGHNKRAWERFTADGPLALLPLGNQYSVVFTLPPDKADAVLALDDDAFTAALQEQFGKRMTFSNPGPRSRFPLALRMRESLVRGREVWIGNTAQTLHPVSGQGFNLGLRDAWQLAEMLIANGVDRSSLENYAASRHLDRHGSALFTDQIVRAFSNDFGPLKLARGLGLLALDLFPPARHFVAKRMIWGARAWP